MEHYSDVSRLTSQAARLSRIHGPGVLSSRTYGVRFGCAGFAGVGKQMVMLAKLLEIPISRGCVLMLYPPELRQGLSQEYWEKGLRRGKAVGRRRLQRQRERNLAHDS